MENLNKWIYTLVITMVFVTFIEILMPSNSMKKYTKMILGLLVMTIILNPVFMILEKNFSLDSYSFKFQSQLDSDYIKKQSLNYNSKQSAAISEIYKQNLQNQMEQQIKKQLGSDVKVKVDVVEDIKSDNFGDIKNITLTIQKGIKFVEKVEKVDISLKSHDNKEDQKDNNVYDSLKNKISSMYNIDKNKIKIILEN